MTAEEILEMYLGEIARVRATGAGTAETSYYAALQAAVNAIGGVMRPRVYCLSQLSGGTSGYPDFGLFSDPQLGEAARPTVWISGSAIPERGVIEADDVPAPLSIKRNSQQVANYLAAYGLVLITNYRDFELLELDASNNAAVVEEFSFHRDVIPFFTWAGSSRDVDDAPTAVAFTEFLRRTLLRRAPLAEPREVASLLASYARDSLSRVAARAGLPELSGFRDALGSSLGLHFQPGPKGDHFFQSTLVQTLYYGLFSAWATHARQSGEPFDWRTTAWSLHVPAVRTLFGAGSDPGAARSPGSS